MSVAPLACGDASVPTLRIIYCDLQFSSWVQLLSSNVLVMTIAVMFVLIGASALSTKSANNDGLIHGNGTVKYLSFECGFYGIAGDDGRNYDPHPPDMPEEFKVDGLRVHFTAKQQGDYVCIHGWGYIVTLFSIEKLQ